MTRTEAMAIYICGEWVPADACDDVTLPYDGSTVGVVPRGDAKHVQKAVAAAQQGARLMRKLTNYERADLLLKIAELLRRDHADFAHIISSESGKPMKEANV